MSYRLLGISLCVLLVVLLGCGPSGPELARVKGVVTLDGKPVPNAILTFIPTGGSTSYGKTNAKGEYELMFTDTKYGAMLGEHKVEIEVKRYSRDEIQEMRAEGQEVSGESVNIPAKYKKDGALSAKVEKGKNQIDFKMDSK